MIALVGTTRHYAPIAIMDRAITACGTPYLASNLGCLWEHYHEACDLCRTIRNMEANVRICWWSPGRRWSRRLG